MKEQPPQSRPNWDGLSVLRSGNTRHRPTICCGVGQDGTSRRGVSTHSHNHCCSPAAPVAAATTTITTTTTTTTTDEFSSDTNHVMNSTPMRNERCHRPRGSTSRHPNTDSKSTSAGPSTDLQTHLKWLWPSRRMYMGNIRTWTLGSVIYLVLILLSHQVQLSYSYPTSLSRRLIEQRMRSVTTVEDYINAFRPVNNTRMVLSRFVNRSPSLNKRSFRRGRAGKDNSNNRESAVIEQVRVEGKRASCQPRDMVVDSYEELGIPRGYGRFIFPECIVVRRCKQGGCCRDDQECVSLSSTNVTMGFFEDEQLVTRGIVHDTECQCQDKPSFCPPPGVDCPNNKVWSYSECRCKCRNRCPKPFMQNEDNCSCDCLTMDRGCKNIARGRRNFRLEEKECECVKRGLCGRPSCNNGKFSVNDCRCLNSSS